MICIDTVYGSEFRSKEETDENSAQILDFDNRSRKTKEVIVTALKEKPLKTVYKHTVSLKDEWEKLCSKCDNKTTSSKLNICTETFS